MLNKLILVFIGGGLGSGIRYIVNIYTQHLNYSQASTLFVNIFGSFLFGLFFVILQSKTSIINVFVLIWMWVHFVNKICVMHIVKPKVCRPSSNFIIS